jgi:hypothetical protein
MDLFNIALSIAPYMDELKKAGLGVFATQDFSEVEHHWPKTGRTAQTPMMDVTRQEFTQSSAFWLFLTENGETIGGLGAKFVDLGDETFDSYLRRTSIHQYSRNADPIEAIARPIRDQISGKLVYIGELEFREGKRGRISVLTAFVGLAKALAAQKWTDFHWMYAFIPEEHIRLARAYEFSYQLPNAIRWKDPAPPGRLNSHWIIAMDRHSFAHSVASRVAHTKSLAKQP